MKAIISRGKNKGKLVTIDQCGNDWFTISTGDHSIDHKPLSPTSLVFNHTGIQDVISGKYGRLFSHYQRRLVHPPLVTKDGEVYEWTFRKLKYL